MTFGFIGLGAMGAPMAARLHAAFPPLRVYNRTREKAENLLAAGAAWAATPAEAASTGRVFSMLTNDAAAEAVTHGPTGILAGLPPGGIHVSCSTLSAAAATALARAHADAGAVFVAAPVLGRPPAAEAGSLYIMAAGPAPALEAIAPALAVLGQKTFLLGATQSAASLTKLLCNFLIFSTCEQLAEVFAIAEKSGLDRHTLFQVLTESFFSAPVHKNYGALIRDRAYGASGVDVALALKDTAMLLQAAKSLAAPLPLASLVEQRLLACAAHNELQNDFAILARQAERDAGLLQCMIG